MYARDAIPFGKPSIADETILATELIQWSIENVEGLTGLTLAPSIGLAGHSRGGQVVWRIANSKIFSVSALVSFDPVDSNGMDANSKITASTLAKVTSLTIGTGLGPETFLGQACAPEGFNYKDFFAATDSGIKSYQLLASSYGHMDMLDESCGLICNVCVAANPNNFPRDDFIGLASGSAVAIFKERLQSIKGEEQAFMNKFRGNKNFIATMK